MGKGEGHEDGERKTYACKEDFNWKWKDKKPSVGKVELRDGNEKRGWGKGKGMGKGKPTLAKKTSIGNGKTRSPLSVS